MILELLLMRVLLENVNQACHGPLAHFGPHLAVGVLGDLPELVEIEILACVDSAGWVLLGTLVLTTEEVFDRLAGGLCLVLALTGARLSSELVSMLVEGIQCSLCVPLQEVHPHVIVRGLRQLLDVSVKLLYLV